MGVAPVGSVTVMTSRVGHGALTRHGLHGFDPWHVWTAASLNAEPLQYSIPAASAAPLVAVASKVIFSPGSGLTGFGSAPVIPSASPSKASPAATPPVASRAAGPHHRALNWVLSKPE